MRLVGQWQLAVSLLNGYTKKSPEAVDRAIRDEAFYFQRKVTEAFRKGGHGKKWSPLTSVTLALRRGASAIGKAGSRGKTPLVRTGDLRKSINTRRRGFGEYFVGVHRSAPRSRGLSKKGVPLVNVAEIHETGLVVIPITAKMRAFFRYLFWKKVIPFMWPPKNKRFIVLRRRSFMQDTMDEFKDGHEARLLTRYANYLGGLGTMKVKEP